MDVEVVVIIELGVVIEFEFGVGWYVCFNGLVNVVGIVVFFIILQGISVFVGYWWGIFFDFNSFSNCFEFVDFVYVGGGIFNVNGDEVVVIIWGDVWLNIFSISIINSGSYGILVVYISSNWSIKEFNISGVSKVFVLFFVFYFEVFDGINIFFGNGQDYFIMDLGMVEININISWIRSSVFYLVWFIFFFYKDVSVCVNSFIIELGMEIFFENGNGIIVYDGGILVV